MADKTLRMRTETFQLSLCYVTFSINLEACDGNRDTLKILCLLYKRKQVAKIKNNMGPNRVYSKNI